MRKIKLDLQSLAVETFETTDAGVERRGTVAGADAATARCINNTAITGSCCDVTLALSCVQTNCLTQCTIVIA
jgi:hypothetical protein